MKPPLTASTKNDSVVVVVQQPTLHNRKIQINQKEILTENQINQQQQQQQQQQQHNLKRNDEISSNYHLDNYTNLPLLTSESSSSNLQSNTTTIKYQNENNSTTSKLIKTKNSITKLTNQQQINNINTTNSYLNYNLDSINNISDINKISQQQSTNLIDVPKNIILSNNFQLFDSTLPTVSIAESSKLNDFNQLYYSYPLDTKNILIDNQSSSSSSAIITNGIDNLIPLLSTETEPLLTNIEETTIHHQQISDPQNSICLNKNSASLIFTKKDLSSIKFDKSINNNNNNNQNNFNSNCSRYTNKSNNLKQNRYSRRSSGALTSCNNKINNPNKIEPIRRNSVTDRNNYFQDINTYLDNSNCINDIELKHEKRKSLQLNYYNTTPSSIGSVIPNTTIITTTTATTTTTTTTNKDNSIGLQRTNSTITTASNRKQLAYSWYAPVYSALEEEIEHDSKDTSPIHNLANIKKINHHQTSSDDNETLSLLENNKNQINIQPQLHQPRVRRQVICTSTPPTSPQPPPATASSITTTQQQQQQQQSSNIHNLTTGSIVGQHQQQTQLIQQQQNDNEGPHASSLLAGGPIPRRRRFENFLKSLVGRKPSKETIQSTNTIIPTTNSTNRINYNTTNNNNNNNNNNITNIPSSNLPSPEITITHSPSEHSLFRELSRISCTSENCGSCNISQHINDDPHGYIQNQKQITNSTLSLNTVQQKILNVVPILRREGSVSSLYNEKSQSIVQYTGLRKCETVLALSRQSSTYSALCGNSNCNRNRTSCGSSSGGGGGGVGGFCTQNDNNKMNGICERGRAGGLDSSGYGCNEPIKPLNRLRNSLSTMNTTCSRCSSLLSLAASGSRYSLNIANSGFVTVNNNNCNATRKTSANAILGFVNNNNNDNNINSPLSSPPLTFTQTTITTVDSPITSKLITTVAELENEIFTCKLCLTEVANINESTIIEQCGCKFCTECMRAYVEFEISEGAYDISCPDAQCPTQGILNILEITSLSSPILIKKHHQYRLNREIEMDKTRMWCPKAGCETICLIGSQTPHNQQQQQQPPTISTPSSTSSPTAITSVTTVSPSLDDKIGVTSGTTLIYCAVQCPTCREEFCSGCKKAWHPNMTCEEFSRQDDSIGIPFDNDLIKCCPMCAVPIEKDEGCAQMMCKRCKHVFCWYCLASLDDDFLLRHYDKGPCKNKLGHSRASVVWHRAQVIGIFAGFGILLLVASPLLLLAAPCIICCKCRICSGAAKIDDPDTDFDEGVALQR